MKLFDAPAELKQGPVIQMAPLIDMVFLTLVFFMTLSVFYQYESELNISVPKAQQAKNSERSPGEIVINIRSDGTVLVNQQKLSDDELKAMLKKISSLFPNQPVIVRADKKTYHEHVIRVLDACAGANIWNIAFSVSKEEQKR